MRNDGARHGGGDAHKPAEFLEPSGKERKAISEARNLRRIGRSIGAVFAGVVATAVPAITTDAVLQATGIFPRSSKPMSDSLFLLATVYRVVYGIAGSYLTARMAPHRPVQHALVLGGIGTALGIVGLAATWGRADVAGHEWYPIALAVLALPQSLLGGALYCKSTR